ncbi:hypothetical protein DFQ30_000051 [Apophysomyces sp. BC1015]|nr:hypothetical protein DFQ30_000051 [Apophysomyces sp. BC1015]
MAASSSTKGRPKSRRISNMEKSKTIPMKKTRKLSKKKEPGSEDEEDLEHLQSELRSHPEYTRVMDKLQQAKHERLSRVQQWRDQERQSIQDWFIAQQKQAWDEFYVTYLVLRCTLR